VPLGAHRHGSAIAFLNNAKVVELGDQVNIIAGLESVQRYLRKPIDAALGGAVRAP